MAGNRKSGRQGKRELYYAEVQSLYLAGKELREIEEIYPVSRQTLLRWQKEGQWEEKRRQALVSPRWLGQALKGILREKTSRLLAKGDLTPPELEELSRLITLIERLCSNTWDIRSAALEVMDRFGEFLREWVKDKEEIRRFSTWMQEFFRKLEEEEDQTG
ncbi:MAG: hypothetical protein WHT07_08150 [Desulfobaccales bacterium]